MKKTLFAVATTAALTSFFGFDSEAEASSTHKVSSGDNLWKIANKYNTTVSNLKSLNNLSSDLIHPNQVIKISASSTSGSGSSSSSAPAPSTGSSTYTVKSGDTLGAIAQRHNMTLATLRSLNNISGHLIYPGQSLRVSGTAQATTPAAPPASNVSQPSGSDTSYTVKSGDTLGRIALNYGVTVANLKSWNNLSSDLIRVGQKLSVKGGSAPAQGSGSSSPAPTTPSTGGASASSVVNVAMSHLGVPYSWGGSSPAGFDCSGFIYYVYKQAGYNISRTNAEGQHARSYEVSSPQVGDLVFFENTYKAGISHVGIYIGNNQFVHANDNGVIVTSLSNSYWKSKFESFKRFY
ncbi:LysM peptidoglycan-binding domain-containing protein [Jeotgalibacillus proteolyticus]|uniref:Peptidoglycan endopeptidase n=1 Tax=Jeotgalibacillus proteolyticus TaxID=2082395 RepID=A0A2S5GB84_9BACL|nr:LysM peptidoglycan-binding domain-containing protein [Jeotgalibacillus proteolyticus]PPA70297.1 peptidoglycan endopeptidase [Jeotgalibacillus proteolyticus]